MARIKYIEKTFKPGTLAVIQRANQICAEYARQGLTLTLRQLYYQFVARGLRQADRSPYRPELRPGPAVQPAAEPGEEH